jgi:lipoyl synthase
MSLGYFNLETLTPKRLKRPDWLKIKLNTNAEFQKTRKLIESQNLNTVCAEARCPNIYECWGRKIATIMILGDICTRACGFCSVKTGKPNWFDNGEPIRTAEAVKKMGLKHVVITSVDRDDMKNDYGATIWADTIFEIKQLNRDCSIEVLTPDFKGYLPALKIVFDAHPDIFSHNIETVERISKEVRTQSNWQRTKMVLQESVKSGLVTKTGLMVGLGETDEEVLGVMQEMADLGVEIFNIGQYLQPTIKHLKVKRYVHPDTFKMYNDKGLNMGYRVVESGPLVRSSYHADEQVKKYKIKKGINE